MSKAVLLFAVLAGLAATTPRDVLQGVPGALPNIVAGEGIAINAGAVSFTGVHSGPLLLTAPSASEAALVVESGVVDWSGATVNLPLHEVDNSSQSLVFDTSCAPGETLLSGSCSCKTATRASYPVSVDTWRCSCAAVGACDGTDPTECNHGKLLCVKAGI